MQFTKTNIVSEVDFSIYLKLDNSSVNRALASHNYVTNGGPISLGHLNRIYWEAVTTAITLTDRHFVDSVMDILHSITLPNDPHADTTRDMEVVARNTAYQMILVQAFNANLDTLTETFRNIPDINRIRLNIISFNPSVVYLSCGN